MLISFNWLKKYVDLPDSITAEDVADRLKLSTVEVESVVFQGAHLEQVVVGEILEIKNHPNADKLHLAQVDVGEKKPRQIVFGQMVKMEVGFKVPVALAPTVLPGNKVIEKVEMRGELTEGMLCLDQEIGLLKDGVSIQFFDKKVKNGTSVVEALKLNDYILEVDNKSLSNRPDLWGHYGMAWEVAALFNKKVADLDIKEFKPGKDVKLKIKIEDTENCTRYIGAVVGGIKIEPSPKWMQDYLKACGVKAINNVVDITNFVNLELGRPSHAFDRRDIKDDTIIVRRAVEGERLTTLDGIERVLKDTMCLVCDAEKPVDLGGIMGGENSEIKPDTTEVILELANFNAANIRKTMSAFDLRTDAGVRFEKTLSPHLAELGLKRILTLMKEIIPTQNIYANGEFVRKSDQAFDLPFRYGKRNMEASLGQGCSLLQSPEGFGVTEEIFESPQDTGRVIYLQIELPAVFSRRVMKAPRLRMIRAGLISQVAQNLSPQPFTPALRKDQEAPLAFFVRLVFSSERHGPHFFARVLFPPWPRPSQRQ